VAIADPKDYAVMKKTSEDTADLRAQIAALSSQVQLLTQSQMQGGGITAGQLKDVLAELVKVQADAHLAAMREIAERDQREDLNYPRISAYNPLGDKAHPRDPFKCRMFWNGFDMDWDTTTAEEIRLLNLVEPGQYRFRRIDGRTWEQMTVTGERNATGALSKLEFFFPTKENRDTLPSMVSMLRDILGVQTPEQQEIARLKAELEKLRPVETVAH